MSNPLRNLPAVHEALAALSEQDPSTLAQPELATAFIREELQSDLDRLQELSIPKDIVFNQSPNLVLSSE